MTGLTYILLFYGVPKKVACFYLLRTCCCVRIIVCQNLFVLSCIPKLQSFPLRGSVFKCSSATSNSKSLSQNPAKQTNLLLFEIPGIFYASPWQPPLTWKMPIMRGNILSWLKTRWFAAAAAPLLLFKTRLRSIWPIACMLTNCLCGLGRLHYENTD